MSPVRLALVGDYSPPVVAHDAIERSLRLLAARPGRPLVWHWLGTDAIVDAPRQLAGYAGVWCVPASPYRSMDGALAAIRFAREAGRPFLGTCGGFQHALIEFARDVLALPHADHAESARAEPHAIGDIPRTPELVITPLACSLVGHRGEIKFTAGSQLFRLIGPVAHEGFHCNYGPNPQYRDRFETAGLRFTAFDANGEIRGFELPGHPFFIGTLFQPERAALTGPVHPLVEAFVSAAGNAA